MDQEVRCRALPYRRRMVDDYRSGRESALDDPNDPVRAEVATALKRKGKRTIPVLIEGSRMPTRSELPEDIRGLSDLNGHLLSDARWRRISPDWTASWRMDVRRSTRDAE